MKRFGAGALLLLSFGCGPALHTRGAGAVLPLAVRPVAWNPSNTAVGSVRAIADGGDVVAVFSDRGATVFSARSPVAVDRSVTDWASAGSIAGADGAARWIVGISGAGRIYHLRGRRTFEDVTDRYGLAGARVLGASALGSGVVGFLLGREIAIADGEHVTRYECPLDGVTFDELAGGAGFGAGVAPSGMNLIDVTRRTMTRYPLPGVTHAAFGTDGRLYATTRRAVYVADAEGTLALVYDATADTIHGLVASGPEVWFADGDELGVVQGDRVAETNGARIGRDARLSPSPGGDVWVLSRGALDRFTRAGATPSTPSPATPSPATASPGRVTAVPTGDAWERTIAPIFARSCSACHLADGISGTDLSTAAAWQDERAAIRERVVERRSMPPPGHPLTEEDRDAIRAWVVDE
jgi:hypothetical protein